MSIFPDAKALTDMNQPGQVRSLFLFPDPNSELDLLDSDDDSSDELEPSMRDAMAAAETGEDLQPADRCRGLNNAVRKRGHWSNLPC